MISEVFIATNNEGKIERYKKLIATSGILVKAYSPKDFDLENIDPDEVGETLKENAEIKAKAYFGKVAMPILSNDTGFWVSGEGFVDAPKRIALNGANEKTLSKEEVGERLLYFWRDVAKKYGGRVDAAWIEDFCVLYPDGKIKHAESRRDVLLTENIFGKPHPQMPVRALYISKDTGKPAIFHSDEEELLEMRPVVDALYTLLSSKPRLYNNKHINY